MAGRWITSPHSSSALSPRLSALLPTVVPLLLVSCRLHTPCRHTELSLRSVCVRQPHSASLTCSETLKLQWLPDICCHDPGTHTCVASFAALGGALQAPSLSGPLMGSQARLCYNPLATSWQMSHLPRDAPFDRYRRPSKVP